jgi:hypothetical protein
MHVGMGERGGRNSFTECGSNQVSPGVCEGIEGKSHSSSQAAERGPASGVQKTPLLSGGEGMGWGLFLPKEIACAKSQGQENVSHVDKDSSMAAALSTKYW